MGNKENIDNGPVDNVSLYDSTLYLTGTAGNYLGYDNPLEKVVL